MTTNYVDMDVVCQWIMWYQGTARISGRKNTFCWAGHSRPAGNGCRVGALTNVSFVDLKIHIKTFSGTDFLLRYLTMYFVWKQHCSPSEACHVSNMRTCPSSHRVTMFAPPSHIHNIFVCERSALTTNHNINCLKEFCTQQQLATECAMSMRSFLTLHQ